MQRFGKFKIPGLLSQESVSPPPKVDARTVMMRGLSDLVRQKSLAQTVPKDYSQFSRSNAPTIQITNQQSGETESAVPFSAESIVPKPSKFKQTSIKGVSKQMKKLPS